MTTDAQQIAEALKDDPFHIDGALEGTLNADLLDQAQETVKSLDYDVFVIAVDEQSLDRDLLEQIKVSNGSEGSFIMINGDSQIAVDVNFEDNHDLEMQVRDQMSVARDEWNPNSPSTTKLNILLDLYAQPQEYKNEEAGTGQEAPGSEVQTVDGSGSFAPMFLGGAVLVLALVIAGVFLTRSLRERAAHRRIQKQFELPNRLLDRVDSLQLRSLREDINADTTQLAEQIDHLHTQKLDAQNVARVERALDAYQTARRIVDDESSERVDLAGAMVLLRQAGREISVVESGKKTRATRSDSRLPQSLCTINPLHGEAQMRVRIETNSTNVRVPVCRSCQEDLQSDNQLQWIFDGDRPYVEGNSVWAQTLFGAIGSDLVTALHRQGR